MFIFSLDKYDTSYTEKCQVFLCPLCAH